MFFFFSPILSQAQDNTRSVIRFVNCTIDDGFTFDEVVEKAKKLDFGENSPNAVFFRRPIYATNSLMENVDMMFYFQKMAKEFQMALYIVKQNKLG